MDAKAIGIRIGAATTTKASTTKITDVNTIKAARENVTTTIINASVIKARHIKRAKRVKRACLHRSW